MKSLITFSIILLITIGSFGQNLVKVETVILNGKKTYYEVYGKGEPLLLLHGYGGSSKEWLSYVVDFYEDFEVYLVDLQGHGKSDIFDSDWSINSVAQNLNDLVEYLKLDRIKAIGFSYGGDILFQMALKNPSVIEFMVTIGCIGSWNVNDYPEFIQKFSYSNIKNLTWMNAYHSSNDQIRALLDYFKNYKVELSDEQLKNIQTEVLIILGDNDISIPLEEVSRARKNLPESDLWILPNSEHAAHLGQNKKEFIRITKSFLIKN